MATRKLKEDSVKIGITTSKRVVTFLDKLIDTGLFGRSRAEVAEQLIKREMEIFLTENKLEKLSKNL